MSATLEKIAQTAWDGVCAYEKSGDRKSWECLSLVEQQRQMENIKKLTERVKNGDVGSMAIFHHNFEVAHYLKSGWKFGEGHDFISMTTERVLPFEECSKEVQTSRFLYCSIIIAMQFAR